MPGQAERLTQNGIRSASLHGTDMPGTAALHLKQAGRRRGLPFSLLWPRALLHHLKSSHRKSTPTLSPAARQKHLYLPHERMFLFIKLMFGTLMKEKEKAPYYQPHPLLGTRQHGHPCGGFHTTTCPTPMGDNTAGILDTETLLQQL